MIRCVRTVGDKTLTIWQKVGLSTIFVLKSLCSVPTQSRHWRSVLGQMYFLGVLSIVIIVVSALFIGMVVALQGLNTLQKFGADSELGQLVALSVFRELGPVVGALLFAGRAGSALTAEIGLMQVTEQIASMEMMAVDPLGRVIFPRLLAGILVLPLLTMIFNACAVYGGYVVGVLWLGVDAGTFWSNMQASVDFHLDLMSGLYKSMAFGVLVTWVAVYQGFFAKPSAEGIGKASTHTVVYASVGVLALDFIMTAMMLGGW